MFLENSSLPTLLCSRKWLAASVTGFFFPTVLTVLGYTTSENEEVDQSAGQQSKVY